MNFDVRKAILLAILYFPVMYLPLLGQGSAAAPESGYIELVNRAFGQDQELVNGRQYYNRHPRSMGHPYLLQGWVHQGSVTLRGKAYDNIWLKYDIESQQVEVEYRTMSGGDNQVVLVNDRIDEFSIENYYFKRMNLEPELSQIQFYQVLGSGPMVWYIRWEKKLVPVSGDSRFIEEYSQSKRHYLVDLNGNVHPFHNDRSFVQLFPRETQKDMKRLIRANHLQIRTASVQQIELFIQAATKLITEGGTR
jgi:hypothetical protein